MNSCVILLIDPVGVLRHGVGINRRGSNCLHATRPCSKAYISTHFVIDIPAIALQLKLHSRYALKIISTPISFYYKLNPFFGALYREKRSKIRIRKNVLLFRTFTADKTLKLKRRLEKINILYQQIILRINSMNLLRFVYPILSVYLSLL